MKSICLKVALCTSFVVFIPAAAHAQSGSEPIFHWVKQSPQDFDHFMQTKRNLGYGVVTNNGRNLLHFAAACQDSFSNVDTLVRNGVDFNQEDNIGQTPLMVAAGSYCHDSVSKLINSGADPKVTDIYGNSAIHYWAMKGNTKHLRFLVGAGGDINGQDVYGRTALHLAAQTLNSKAVEALVKSQADVNLKDEFGVTPLSLIMSKSVDGIKKRDKKKREKVIGYLEGAGADVGANWNSQSYSEAWAKDKIAPKVAEIKAKSVEVAKSKIKKNPAPFKCGTTEFENMTSDQGEAVKYVLEQEKEGDAGRLFCIVKITANQKIPLRGNTVIKYRAIFEYPNGYNTNCLKPKPGDFWSGYEHDMECNTFLSGKPLEPGTKTYYDGTAEI